MNYLKSCPCAHENGYHRVLEHGDAEMKLTQFGLLHLAAGQSFRGDTGDMEAALVILSGKCSVHGQGFRFADIGERVNVFSGLPYTVYLPCQTKYEITAVTEMEMAVAESPSSLAGPAQLIRPEQTKSFTIGRDNFKRDAVFMIDDKFPSEHFFIGEAFVPSGNWASYPPHRHDFDRLPDEVDMEEIYFFRFDPPKGFGVQKIYTDDRTLDLAYTVQNNDTVAIPRGYHPVINAPGYEMYYLWVMTGRNRAFISHKDTDHSWVK